MTCNRSDESGVEPMTRQSYVINAARPVRPGPQGQEDER